MDCKWAFSQTKSVSVLEDGCVLNWNAPQPKFIQAVWPVQICHAFFTDHVSLDYNQSAENLRTTKSNTRKSFSKCPPLTHKEINNRASKSSVKPEGLNKYCEIDNHNSETFLLFSQTVIQHNVIKVIVHQTFTDFSGRILTCWSHFRST